MPPWKTGSLALSEDTLGLAGGALCAARRETSPKHLAMKNEQRKCTVTLLTLDFGMSPSMRKAKFRRLFPPGDACQGFNTCQVSQPLLLQYSGPLQVIFTNEYFSWSSIIVAFGGGNIVWILTEGLVAQQRGESFPELRKIILSFWDLCVLI